MIARIDIELNAEVPDEATFWTPTEDDIDEEGFGFFRDVWPILGVSQDDAKQIIDTEAELVDLLAEFATDAATFDLLASAVETMDPSELSGDLVRVANNERIAPLLETDVPPLDGLEIGVAGLVYALSSIGCYPAASCRGHVSAHAWSPGPVVLFAAESGHVDSLGPLVLEAGCGFAIDPNRPDLLTILARSIEEMVALARLVVDRPDAFPDADSA